MRTQLGPMSSCVEFGCAVLNRIFKMTVSLQIGDLKMVISELSKLRLLRGTRRGRRQDGGGVTAAMLIFLIKCK